MTKEEAINRLWEEKRLYDIERKQIYVPDVLEPFLYNGIQVSKEKQSAR